MKRTILSRLMLVILSLLVCTPVVLANPKMILAVFVDTNDKKNPTGREATLKMYDRLAGQLKESLGQEGVEVQYLRFIGNRCTPDEAKRWLNNLSCDGDIVMFAYNGHGGRSHKDKSKFPRMCLGSDYVEMEVADLVEGIKSHNPRLQIVVADCCNSYYDRPSQGFKNGENKSPSASVLKKLFLQNGGDVCITAASPGQYGWTNTAYGSYLSGALMDVLGDATEGATWQSVMQGASDLAFNMTNELYKSRQISNAQRAVFDVNVGRAGEVGGGSERPVTKPRAEPQDSTSTPKAVSRPASEEPYRISVGNHDKKGKVDDDKRHEEKPTYVKKRGHSSDNVSKRLINGAIWILLGILALTWIPAKLNMEQPPLVWIPRIIGIILIIIGLTTIF